MDINKFVSDTPGSKNGFKRVCFKSCITLISIFNDVEN